MNTLYIECKMGAAGDMLSAALLELIPDREAFISKLNKAGIPGVVFLAEKMTKCGITGTHMKVTVNGAEEDEHMHDHHDHEPHHHHSGMHDIEHIVRDHLDIPDEVKDDVMAVYGLIAEAESHVHGVPVTDIHFHEVGTMDAVADITAVCMLIHELSPDEIVVSPVHVGSGTVRCAHGILPVPAPATAYILQGVPTYGGRTEGELCTPTGAAILKHFADRFGDMPVMKTDHIGYGMGRKDFETANCVRVMFGERFEDCSAGYDPAYQQSGISGTGSDTDREETVYELSCNVDDMSAEEIGYACERFFEGGALEVYTVPIGMKKTRPGTLIRVMCDGEHKADLVRLIYRYTSTIGLRETATHRYILDRRTETIKTPYGEVRCKISEGYGVIRRKYEYEDLARIAKACSVSISEARRLVGEHDRDY